MTIAVNIQYIAAKNNKKIVNFSISKAMLKFI